jgi:hypothetical protein
MSAAPALVPKNVTVVPDVITYGGDTAGELIVKLVTAGATVPPVGPNVAT